MSTTERCGAGALPELLDELRRRGIAVRAEGGQLRVEASGGVATPEIMAALRAHKSELLEWLSQLAVDDPAAAGELPPLVRRPEERHEPFELTDLQQAYWVGRRGVVEHGTAIHVYVEIASSELDVGRLQDAWNRLVARHEMLRAVVDDSGRQRVLESVPDYEIAILDLRDAAPEACAATLADLRARMSAQVMALDSWPLFELRAVRLPDATTRLFFDLDCTLTDSWGAQVLFRELAASYRDPAAALDPPVLDLTLRDYLLSVRAIEGTPAHARSVAYWDERLDTLPPPPELPLRRGPAPHGATTFRRWVTRMSADEFGRLGALAIAHGLTPTSVLIAAFAETIGRWAKAPRFTLNIPLYNRLPIHPHVGGVVGTFSSLSLLEVDRRQGATFAERAIAVHEQMLADLEHRQGGGVRVLRELNRRRGTIGGAAMPVVFTSFAGGVDGVASFWIDDLAAELGEVVHSVTQTPQVWIDQQVLHQHGGLYLNWDVCEELFPEGLVDEMFDAYVALVSRLAGGEAAWHDPHLAVPEHLPAAAAKAPAVDLPQGLVHEGFLRHAGLHPDRPAVLTSRGALSYGELHERALRVAAWLLSLDAPADAPVAVVLPGSWQQMTAAYGALLAGRAYMPLDVGLPSHRLARLLERAGAAAVLSDAERVAVAPADGPPWSTVERLVAAAAPLPCEPPQRTIEDHFAVIHTSGTTGLPAGVLLPHKGLRNAIEATRVRFGIGAEDRMLALTPAHHDMSLYDLFGVLAGGGAVVVPDEDRRRDPAHWIDLIHEHRVTLWNSVPPMAQMLVDHLGARRGLAGAALRLVLLGGDAMALDLPPRLREHLPGLEISNVGGPAETTLWNIWFGIDEVDPDWVSIPYGRPLPNQHYHVMDEALRERPVWAAGELCCSGIGLATGYLGEPERTAQRFVADPVTGERLYRTGDLGRRRPDGVIELLGRIDFQLNILGRRIEPSEIEAALCADPRVSVAVVVPTERRGTTILTAYFTSPAAVAPTAEDLAARMRDELPAYLVPHRYVRLDALPTTASAKIDRKALTARASGEQAASDPAAAAAAPGHADVELRVGGLLAELLAVERVDPRRNFFDLGATSVHLVQLHAALRDRLGIDVPITDMYAHSTVAALTARLRAGDAVAGASARLPAPAADDPVTTDHVAIVGMSCRFPGAPDVATFWRNLLEGRESVRALTDGELLAAGVAPATLRRRDYVRAAAMLDDVAGFDADLLGFSAREAELTDPQQRLFVECAWEALEAAGYRPGDPDVSVGVFAGKSISNYLFPVLDLADPVNYFQVLFGNDKDYIATQASYKLDLTGPSVSMQTACSTSLVTIDAACAALRSGSCDLALSGGASIKLPQAMGYDGSPEAGMFSPDGRTRPFDADAAGIVPGSGVGVVVLKRLDRALADGDHVHAVIRGTAVNNDGAGKVGFTAPSVAGQRRCIEQAQLAAGVTPETISYIEAHGTGTPMGDPIEVAALREAFAPATGTQWCALGSVKSNFGHLDSAAGVAGLIKAALALEHEIIPPTINFARANPAIDFASSPFFVAADALPWPRGEAPRRAGVSSFGVGGTNAHVVLEQAPLRTPVAAADAGAGAPVAVPISAKTPEALREYAQRWVDHLDAAPHGDLADLAYTAQVGRAHLEQRAVVVAQDAGELRLRCAALAAGRDERGVVRGARREREAPRIAFLFPGHGSQYVGMGRTLYEHEPRFRDHIDRCDELLRSCCDVRLVELLYPPQAQQPRRMHDIVGAQVALFAVMTALAEIWRSRGIVPAAIMGHSLGELAGAHVAGVLSLEDALALVATRIELIESHGRPGRTILALCGEADVAPLLAAHAGAAGIASFNAPESLVLSGEEAAMRTVEAALAERGIATRDLHAPRAAHSALMDPVLAPLERAAASLDFHPPRVPLISNLTGKPLGPQELDAAYVGRHVRSPVRLTDGFAGLRALGCDTFVEVGPRPTLALTGRECLPDPGLTWTHSLRPARDDRSELLASLGRLHVAGADIAWEGLHPPRARRRVPAPTYPFQRRRYWSPDTIQARRPAETASALPPAAHPLLGRPQHAPGHAAGELHFEAPGIGAPGSPSWLREHGGLGIHLLPATGFVELALAAARRSGRDGAAVRDLVVHRPLVLPAGGEVLLHVGVEDAHADGAAVRIHAAAAERPAHWVLHAEALLGEPADAASLPALDLDALRDARAATSGAEHYRVAAERGAEFGARFRSLDAVWIAPGGGLGHIVAAAELRDELDRYVFHPALFDACLQAVMACVCEHPGDAIFLPASIGRCTLLAGIVPELWSHVELVDEGGPRQVRANITICDHGGRVVALVEDLRLIAVDRSELARLQPRGVAELVHRRVWHAPERAPERAGGRPGATVTIVASEAGLPDAALLALALASGYDDVTVADGAHEPAGNGRVAPRRDVVYLAARHADPTAERLSAELWRLARLVRALAARPGGRLTVVTTGSQHVAAGERPCPIQAGVWAFGGVAASEHPELGIRRVDLDPADPACATEAARWIAGEDAAAVVALREGRPLVPRLERAGVVAPGGSLVLDGDASYLVTGGCGRLGRLTAELLFERGARWIVLLGRHATASEDDATVTALRARGARVSLVDADVGDLGAVQAVVTRIESGGHPLRGVFHAAGILADALVDSLTEEQLRAVCAPKLGGAVNLARATAGCALDHFVLFSSAAASLGAPGQAAYAAANAALGAFAERRVAAGLPALCIDWGPWGGTATASGDARLVAQAAAQGLDLLAPALGTQALELLMAGSVVHPLVLAASAGGPLATQPAAAAAAAAADAPAPFAETLAALGTDAAHDRLERIVREHLAALTGIADAHAIADDSGFASLGLDSMGAMELRNRVQAQIEHRLPATVAFNYPTVATLTAHLARVLAPEADACAPAPASEAALSGLSTRQLGALLDARLNAIGREETGS